MEILRTAYVYVRNVYAGELCETDDGYLFSYDSDYIESYGASAVSLTILFLMDLFQRGGCFRL